MKILYAAFLAFCAAPVNAAIPSGNSITTDPIAIAELLAELHEDLLVPACIKNKMLKDDKMNGLIAAGFKVSQLKIDRAFNPDHSRNLIKIEAHMDAGSNKTVFSAVCSLK